MNYTTIPCINSIFPDSEFKRSFILVLGLGKSGFGMACWCLKRGLRVRVADTRVSPPMKENFDNYVRKIKAIDSVFVPGPFKKDLLDNVFLILLSPGLSPLEVNTATLISKARKKSIPIWGEFEFFARVLRTANKNSRKTYCPRIIAVTGTNGKTTTCSMIAHLLAQKNLKIALAGNIGSSLFKKLLDEEESEELPEIWIIEASSFQLASSETFIPDAAAILNITQDHLDWHGNLDAYRRAKFRIFSNSKTLRILCRDDETVNAFVKTEIPCVTYGSDPPANLGDFGIVKEKDATWLVQSIPDGLICEGIRQKIYNLQEEKRISNIDHLIPLNSLPIRGKHNVLNIQAALALIQAIDIPLVSILHRITSYVGEPHRNQLVATIRGIDYVDDSKGTNISATISAITDLDRPIWLIVGGDGKGQDFSLLAPAVKRNCRGVFLIGKDSIRIGAALSTTGVAQRYCQSLEVAVSEASLIATHGDVILMSPACASFDMFEDYIHRAKVFHSSVAKHAREMGILL